MDDQRHEFVHTDFQIGMVMLEKYTNVKTFHMYKKIFPFESMANLVQSVSRFSLPLNPQSRSFCSYQVRKQVRTYTIFQSGIYLPVFIRFSAPGRLPKSEVLRGR